MSTTFVILAALIAVLFPAASFAVESVAEDPPKYLVRAAEEKILQLHKECSERVEKAMPRLQASSKAASSEEIGNAMITHATAVIYLGCFDEELGRNATYKQHHRELTLEKK